MKLTLAFLLLIILFLNGCSQHQIIKEYDDGDKYATFERFIFTPGSASNESQASIGNVMLTLFEPDDPKEPMAWQGPLLYRNKSGKNCKIKLSIIKDVYNVNSGNYLIVVTYSGSEDFITIIDPNQSCKVISLSLK